ncbi:MAG: cation:proton antiporter [Verrucomicrobiota bacterium]
MEHHALIRDLCWILLAAGAAAVIFHWLRQPLILGYLLAGFLLGPYFPLFPTVNAIENVQALSELGVIFLMFYIGLEFDVGKLRKTFIPAFLALAIQTFFMMLLGLQAGAILGWPYLQSFFLGGVLSISSSMVTVSFLRRKGDLTRPYAGLTISTLIMEDILAILFLVLITGTSVNGNFAWHTVGRATFLVGIFIVVVFLLGKLMAPRLLFVLKKFGDPEVITLFTVGLILGVSLLAQEFQFSLALGAFLAGAILSRTTLAREIERLTEPLRDVLTALFFVAMGMLIVPEHLLRYGKTILVLSALMIAGKIISCWMGFVLAGQRSSTSFRASLPKAQIGEFSFIIAAMGATAHVTDERLKAVASGVAFVSIFLTPVFNARVESWVQFGRRHEPKFFKDIITLYHNWLDILRLGLSRSVLAKTVYRIFTRVGVNFLLFNALILLGAMLTSKIDISQEWSVLEVALQEGVFIVIALLGLPFVVDILRNLDVIVLLISETALERSASQRLARGIFKDVLTFILRSIFLVSFGIIFLLVSAPYLPSGFSVILFILVSISLAILLWRKAVRFHHRMEGAVLRSMVDQSRAALAHTIEGALKYVTQQNPWDAIVEEVEIARDSKFIGMKVKDLGLRNLTGVTIIAVRRSDVCLYDALPDIPLFPHDSVLLFGEKNQIESASQYLNQSGKNVNVAPPNYSLEKVLVPPRADIAGLSLKELNFPKNYGVTVLGIQRGNQKITGPKAEEIVERGDILFVMGTPEALKHFQTTIEIQ